MDFGNINYWAVLIGALAAFVLGAIWYSKALFGSVWQKLLGFTDEYLRKGNMAAIMTASFILMLIMSFGMAMLIQGHEGSEVDWLSGLYHGLIIGVVFAAASIGINYLYQRRSFSLWLIDAGYQVLFLTIMGIILGAWH